MNKSFQTPAFIIKRGDFGEADRLLTLFTAERGKVRAINRGARKPLSKLAGHLEPFMLTDCQLQEGRNLYTVTAAQVITTHATIRHDLHRTSLAYAFLEMIDVLVVDEEPQPVIFELLTESLELLAEDISTDLLVAAFRLQLLTDLGYRPELHHCIHCREPLAPSDNRFSLALGGLLGPECRTVDDIAQPISADTIKAMRLLIDHSMTIVRKLQLQPQTMAELNRISENYLHYHVGRGLHSADFVRDLAT